MNMATPRSQQGQMVEYSYGWLAGEFYMREYDRTDRSISWYVADERSRDELSASDYDAGGSDYPPAVKKWTACPEPREDD